MSEAITTERMSIDVPEVRVREQGEQEYGRTAVED
jgi:hypothetical protein